MDELLTTAERLRELIKQKNITYVELERLSGVPKSAIQRYASGATKKIPLDRIFRISDALGVSPYDLVGGDRPWGTDQALDVEWAKWDFKNNPLPPDPADDDLWTLREDERRDPDRKALFMLAKHGTAQDIRQANAIIDALKATNPDYYDGDDPA